jgi:hypothetical protein
VLKSLAEVIREKLDAGTLPHDEPVLIWPGIGSGKACSACGHPILRAQTELVPQWNDDRPIVVFHLECHGHWHAERRLRRYQRPKPGEQSSH